MRKRKATSRMASGARISPAVPSIAVLLPLRSVCRRSKVKPAFAIKISNMPRPRCSQAPPTSDVDRIRTSRQAVNITKLPDMLRHT
jgi:hypothetical protein